jgi:rfaE bifunctional protein kinase chain/domain
MSVGHSDYRRKIKTREELRAILGPRPRPRRVIMCHGTFDLVHPGHVRHLIYARTKADILVASLTGDAHISKANFRPFVPQQLRAMNLAAFEVVDYVVIDDNPEPLENILFLQPDYFAKGYEYTSGGLPPKTAEEVKALESYGGEIIFTPGDVVFSSSAFIEQAPPNLTTEKLAVLMESENITFDALRRAVANLAGIRAHVVGDTIVDSQVHCSLLGGISKAPVPSLKYDTQVDCPGGAAVVAKHLRQAGAHVRFSTVLGDDPLKDFIVQDLQGQGITCAPFVDHTRPTTQKNVFLADGQRMLRVNKLDNRPISDRALEHLKAELARHRVDVAIFSDFRHGIFGRRTIPELTACLPAGALSVADSQVASRWGNILDFQGFDLITPNELEARFALGDQDSTIRPLALDLYKRAACKTLILKLGDKGIITYRAPSHDVRSFFTVDSFADKVADPVGAGDALLAYAALALVATGSPVIASVLGSIAAAVICERDINHPVAPADILRKLDTLERRMRHLCAA